MAAKKSLVSQKIPVLRREGIPEKQAVAMAISMNKAGRLRQGGKYVPARKSSRR